MIKTSTLLLALSSTLWIAGCGESGEPGGDDNGDGTHTHADGTVHKDGDDAQPADTGHGDDHGIETPLPTATIGDDQVELTQAKGAIQPGKEGILLVKLPYKDNGETIVRAWIGTEDRTRSMVGKGVYAPSHGDYDIHTMAPESLPENVMWWVEIEKPNGTKAVGSTTPLTE